MQKIFPNLVSTTSPTALTPNGTLGVNYIGFVAPIVEAIKALVAEVQGFATSFTTQQLCVADSSGAKTCITKAQLDALLANAGSSGSSGGGSSAPGGAASGAGADTTAPVITLKGDNPATISVGDTYSDLGASVSDNVDTNLGYSVSVDGGATTTPSQIHIDTSVAGTHSIIYSATDAAGNTGTATREVDVVAATSTQQ